MAVTPNLGLASPLASAVAGWIARLKSDLDRIDQAFAGAGASGANMLVNPGFGVNQRLQSSYAGDGTFTFDRWMISYGGGVTLTVSLEAVIYDALSAGSAKCVFVLGAGDRATLEQLVEGWAQYRGQALTLRMRVKCATPNAVRLAINDGTGLVFSAYHTGGGGWETLTLTRTLDAAASTLKVGAYFAADCTAYLDNGTLALGSTPLPYAPLSASENLRRCQRYYEVQGQGGGAGHPVVHGYAGAGAEVWRSSFPWAVPKGGLPTVSLLGTWGLVNASGVAVAAANESGYALAITSAAAGQCEAAPNSAGDVVIGEWNP